MQPAASEIERKRRTGNRIGSAADPASSIKDGERNPRRRKPHGGADSGGARTDDNDLEIVCAARKHKGSIRIDLPRQPDQAPVRVFKLARKFMLTYPSTAARLPKVES